MSFALKIDEFAPSSFEKTGVYTDVYTDVAPNPKP